MAKSPVDQTYEFLFYSSIKAMGNTISTLKSSDRPLMKGVVIAKNSKSAEKKFRDEQRKYFNREVEIRSMKKETV
jgi:hypothetical protein